MKTAKILTSIFLAGMLLSSEAETTFIAPIGNWSDALNWSPASVPTSATVVHIGSTSGFPTAVVFSENAFADSLDIGGGTGTVGFLTVTNGWTLTYYTLSVGAAGNGTLTIEEGSTVTEPAVQGTSATIGLFKGATGIVTVRDPGSTWNNDVTVGHSGNGTLDIQSGGTVNSGIATIGYLSAGTGVATVDGIGSVWNISASFSVGVSGNGTLNIQSGGSVSSKGGSIGSSNGTGVVTVNGIGSTWNLGSSSSSMNIGTSIGGNGTLNIQSGGSVVGSSVSANIGAGSVTVSGTGSTLNLGSSGININGGSSGNGSLNIQSGGTVTSGGGQVGNFGNTGSASVTGTGSAWNLGGGVLYVGAAGTGTVTVDLGGKTTALSTNVGFNGTGILNLNGTAGSRGVLETGFISEGNGISTTNFNGGILRATGNQANFLQGFETGDIQVQSGGAFFDTQNFSVGISTVLQGAGGITKQGTGTLTLSGANAYTGPTVISAGKLIVNGSIASSSLLTVNAGGTLGGSGAVGALSIASGGTVSPGNSPGTLSTGAMTWEGGGSYLWEVNAKPSSGTAGTNWDFINMNGGLNISATSANKFTISISGNVTGLPTSTPQDWTILTASSGFGGTFNANEFILDTTNFTANSPGNFSLLSQGNNLVLEYAPTPEPGTALLMVVGGMALAMGRRRHASSRDLALVGLSTRHRRKSAGH
jgi:T5SS/PEP-CTERM-associated repeat protein